jgi:hypothetical protein
MWGVAADAPRLPRFGVGFDVGVPDGIALNLFFRPIKMLRLEAGPLYNIAGFGIRGGVTFAPIDFVISPTLTAEVGSYFSGNVGNIVQLVSHQAPTGGLGAALSDVRYSFTNLHLGLEIGSPRSVMFTLHFGLSYVWGKLPGLGQSLQNSSGDSTLTIQDPTFRFIVPSAKVGLMVFFG